MLENVDWKAQENRQQRDIQMTNKDLIYRYNFNMVFFFFYLFNILFLNLGNLKKIFNMMSPLSLTHVFKQQIAKSLRN